MQLTHYDKKFSEKHHPITLICDGVNNAPNIGSLFRIADAMGIEKIIFCGKDIPIGRRMTKTSRSTEKFVVFEVANSVMEIIENFKNHQIIALEITQNSKALKQLIIEKSKPIALIVGNIIKLR